MSNSLSGKIFTLAIGPLRMGVICPDEQTYKRLAARYTNFLGEPALEWQIRIIYSHQENDETTPDGINFIGDRLWVNDAGGWGWVSIPEKLGELNLGLRASEGTVDYFLRAAFALQAFKAGGFMLHAAGIINQGKVYCFFGPSGSGKTTVAKFSRLGSVLNDDLLVFLPDEEDWVVHGTPFTNPTQAAPSNQSAKLAGLFRLVQDGSDYLESLNFSLAMAELFACLPVISADPSKSQAVLPRLQDILAKIPVQKLHFKKNSSFWSILN